jgi:hypothetical protein
VTLNTEHPCSPRKTNACTQVLVMQVALEARDKRNVIRPWCLRVWGVVSLTYDHERQLYS